MKLTTEERKHLVTRTFTENKVTFDTVDFATMETTTNTVKIGGKFETEQAMKEYVFKKYNDFNRPINPTTIKIESRDVKYAMSDVDFMKYGFILNDETEETEA